VVSVADMISLTFDISFLDLYMYRYTKNIDVCLLFVSNEMPYTTEWLAKSLFGIEK